MQNWKKLGLILDPKESPKKGFTHAALPVGELVDKNHLQLFFSSRNSDGCSVTRSAILDVENKFQIVEWIEADILLPGTRGTFDDSGAIATCMLKMDGDDYLYYVGWNNTVTVPFRNSLGLAIRKKGEKVFNKAFPGPVLDRSPYDASFVASCCIEKIEDGYRMYYLSCDEWIEKNGRLEHKYNIKIAHSKDAVHWDRRGLIAIDYMNDEEYAISTPRVIREADKWRMWFSCRGNKYRVGYAESSDGMSWQRKDEEMDAFNKSEFPFESDMICYPFLFEHNSQLYMLYNGNGYGQSGIGAAVLT